MSQYDFNLRDPIYLQQSAWFVMSFGKLSLTWCLCQLSDNADISSNIYSTNIARTRSSAWSVYWLRWQIYALRNFLFENGTVKALMAYVVFTEACSHDRHAQTHCQTSSNIGHIYFRSSYRMWRLATRKKSRPRTNPLAKVYRLKYSPIVFQNITHLLHDSPTWRNSTRLVLSM